MENLMENLMDNEMKAVIMWEVYGTVGCEQLFTSSCQMSSAFLVVEPSKITFLI